MDSFQRAIQINGKLFFKFRFWIFGQKPKNFQMNGRGLNIDQIAMYYKLYQWICLNKFYKQTKSFFFQISS